MTLLAATCALVDDIVDSGSFLRTEVSACDFGVLGETAACAVTVRPGVSSFNYIGYGGVTECTWGLTVSGWVEDTGNVTETLANVIHMHDALRAAIVAIVGGSRANCASLTTRVTAMSHNPDVVYNYGGPDFLLVNAMVTAREDP
jgi:hypothetical protein